MTERMQFRGSLLVVNARIWGPEGYDTVLLAIDTGAAFTMMPPDALAIAGYDVVRTSFRTTIVTANGVALVPVVRLQRFAVFGKILVDFPVVSHHLPAASPVRGLLGLDFFHGTRLTLDFRGGTIALE